MKSAQTIWEAALGALQIQVNRPNYETWLKDTVGISYDDGVFIVGAPNTFVAEWLDNRLCSLVKQTLASIVGCPVNVLFQVHAADLTPASAVPAVQADGGLSTKLLEPVKRPKLNQKYTFDTFIAGECNRLAHAAALEVAEVPGENYNPLFIYGGTGVGKTHLLHAIGHYVYKIGRLRTIYVSAEHLTNEFVASIKNGKTDDFHRRFRNADIFLFDDIQFLSGKSQTQECFFHLFNDLYDVNCQIVITSDRPPRELGSLEEKLRSRLAGGLVADMQPPGLETRLAILEITSQNRGISLPPDVCKILAMRFPHSIRELEGGLTRVCTYAKLNGMNLDAQLTLQALGTAAIHDSPEKATITPKHIVDTVAAYYAISPDAICGKRRDRETALARQITMYLIRDLTHLRLDDIGKTLGGRDHTTVLHGCQKITNEINVNPQLSKIIKEIRHEIKYKKPSG